jgi:type IV secretion system protein VirB9
MIRATFWVVVLALAFMPASAEIVPSAGGADARVRETEYRPNEVYRLRGYLGYQIDLEFDSGETFIGLGAGDIDALTFAGQDNHLFLKPKAVRVATNITVLTNRRHYHIDYSASAVRPGPNDPNVIYALRFKYPEVQAAAVAAAELDARLLDGAKSRSTNIDYWYCGHPAIRPIEASDDGVHTRLRFSPHTELPAIFVRNDDGTESLLNFSFDAGDVIVHRVARRLVLRRGKVTGCIVNQGFTGGGARLDTGTVAPEVERVAPGTRRP